MPWYRILAVEPLEAGSNVSVRFPPLRSQGSWDGYQPGRVVHFWCRKLVHFQLSLDNSNQRQRWVATALLDVEPGLRRIRGVSPSAGVASRAPGGALNLVSNYEEKLA